MIYIPIGMSCGTAIDLKKQGKRTSSYPFDWVFTTPRELVRLLDTRFEGFFVDDLEFSENPNPSLFAKAVDKQNRGVISKWVVRNRKTNFISVHDLARMDELGRVRKLYARRIERLYRVLAGSKPVTFVWSNKTLGTLKRFDVVEDGVRKYSFPSSDFWNSGFKEWIETNYPDLEFYIEIIEGHGQ